MKRYLLPFLIGINLYSQEIITDTKNEILQNNLNQSIEDAKLQKDSWINPAVIEVTDSKYKLPNTNTQLRTKKASINIEQEIFKSGAILQSISKGKNLETLSRLTYEKDKKEILFYIYANVISLNIIDLNLKKLQLLLENKELEADKKLDLYNNGLLDINELDETIIELSELKNSIEDLNIEKSKFIAQLKNISSKNYQEISLDILSNISMDQYLDKNLELETANLAMKDSKYDYGITKASYLPKASLYGSYGYEDMENQKNDDYYQYGLKISMPLDYNYKKSIQSAKYRSYVMNAQLKDKKNIEKNSYISIQENLTYLDKKIEHTKTILKRYESINELVFDMYQNLLKTKSDYTTISNRLKVINLDIKTLEFEKKYLFNELFKNTNI
jgi:outer membrane protein TolC